MNAPQKILIIQTAFLGDVVLATALLEKLYETFPQAQLDFLLRKGNDSLLQNHPYLNHLYIWDKKQGKFKDLYRLLREIRKEKYDLVINLQRFGATGLLTALSGGRQTVGFDKNPFSRFFSRAVPHSVSNGLHETERNQKLIEHLTGPEAAKPKLYPSQADFEKVAVYKTQPYICVAPSSIWFTKQYPEEKWVELLKTVPADLKVYLLGAPSDKELCDRILQTSGRMNAENLCGKLSLLQSAALQQDAVLSYVNDSGPMHLASSTNAPVAAVYCSTVPSFGFGPLSDFSRIVETEVDLPCRPCGLHGYMACPQGHFKCALTIKNEQLLAVLEQALAEKANGKR
ncbi:glycosyltransferase family 9 protein [Adhaeribacter sp. BT258]|uniref:Glycosyltransferase family 9 protein n=1 Tax=Adhaeribacter terrigena TaxID=2793070 RepID=A0ABS1C6F7_9BACT|nr:glycosyltransferase family 9 protein [Adhaeribacter terrigena]MBK0404150.1 glycosyltransferase family 9 protein [Adhaeribacter terrigena]